MEQAVEKNKTQPRKEFNTWVVYLVCLLVSLCFMFFFGLNSPLHTFNPHCDYQWFLTMGRGMAAGKVPYRDLFEQKGPIVFVVFMVSSWFPHPQFAVWLFEVFCISLFLFFCYRIARKFLSPWVALAVLPLMMVILSTNYVRGIEGSCVEEYCLPIFAYGFLCFMDFLLDRRPVTWQRSLALGICFGILFWVKYSLLEFFLFPLLIWLVVNLVERQWRVVIRSCLIMLGGFLLVTVPVIISFAAFGALDDLWRVYFVINITHYDGNVQHGDVEQTYTPWGNLLRSSMLGGYYLIFMIWGLICFAIHRWRQKSGWLMLIAVIPTWLMVGFLCGYPYYYIPLFTYAVIGVIYSLKLVVYTLNAVELTAKRCAAKVVWVMVAFVLSFFSALPFVVNLKEINRPRENYAPLMVADIIHEYNQTAEQPATLFCYLMADCGFYNAAGVIPNVYYYAQNCFTKANFPEMFDAFETTITEQKCDFVVTYIDTYQRNRTLLDTYYQPYQGDLQNSILPFSAFEPGGYIRNQIVVLFRK